MVTVTVTVTADYPWIVPRNIHGHSDGNIENTSIS